jgi:pimeloyl-ACP methyl ester carboxylesterase
MLHCILFALFQNGEIMNYLRTGSGHPLLLLHGFPLDNTTWQPLLPHLTAHFDVILPDLAGLGHSPLPRPDTHLTDMAAALADLLRGLGLPRAFVAGHSMGGYVALAFARQSPEMLLGLGLISTQALPDNPERQAARHQTAAEVAAKGPTVVADAMAAKLSADPAHEPLLRETILRQPVPGIINALKAMAGRSDSSDLLLGLDCPVSIIHGLDDALIPPERAREMKTLLPNAYLTELPGVGHMPMLESPVATAGALKKLL